MKTWANDMLGGLFLAASLLMLPFFFALLGNAATPEPKAEPDIELPRWQFGRPQQIESSLFPE